MKEDRCKTDSKLCEGTARGEASSGGDRGIILVTVILALLAMAIFLPALLFFVQNETKWTVKQKKTTTAFHMAEQGMDRGVWKLQESDDIWTSVSTGGIVTGYNFDVVYISSDIYDRAEGEYKIRISSGTEAATVLIRSVGRDRSTDEVRAVEAVYTKVPVNAGLQSRTGMAYKPGLIVHWGPVISFSDIGNPGPSDYYPRKIAKAGIFGRDDVAALPNGHDFYSTWPEPASYDYNSFQSKLGNPATIDLEQYKTVAKNSLVPALEKHPNGAAYSTPTGSGYYTDNGEVHLLTAVGGNDYRFDCSTCVIYIAKGSATGDLTIQGNSLSQLNVKALIVEGVFDANGKSGLRDMVTVIPVGARKEYLHPSAIGTWTSVFASTGEGGNYYVKNARVKGYVYVVGEIKNSGGAPAPTFIGVVDVAGTVSVNNSEVYFDASVATSVLALNVKPSLEYWREYKTDW